MHRFIYIAFLASTAGCLFSSGADLPNVGDRGDAEVKDVRTADVGDVGVSPDTRSNDGGRSDADSGPIVDVGADMDRDSGTPGTPTTTLLTGTILPDEIRVLNDPFQIVLMNQEKTEVWSYDPTAPSAEKDTVVELGDGTGGNNLAVAKADAETDEPKLLISTGRTAYECTPMCSTLAEIIGLGIDEGKQIKVKEVSTSWNVTIGSSVVSVPHPGEFSIRSFPTGEGAVLFTERGDTKRHHYVSDSKSCQFSGDLLWHAIPIHDGHFVGLSAKTGPATLGVNTTTGCQSEQMQQLKMVASDVVAFDAYRFGDSTYVAYSTQDKVEVAKFNADNFRTQNVGTIGVGNTDIVSIALDDDWFLVVTRTDMGKVEVHQFPRSNSD